MFQYQNTKIVSHDIRKVYNVITDVREYPKFIPWCAGAKVISQDDKTMLVDLVILFNGLNMKYTSLVSMKDEVNTKGEAIIKSVMKKGIMKEMSSCWFIKQVGDNKTQVNFDVSFSLKSKILEKLMAQIFKHANKRILTSFEDHIKEA